MEHKLSKKAKIFLSVASTITANTAITTLLTSCSLSNKINDIGGFDNQYGINDATYTRMEEDFEELYKSQLDQRKASGEINDDAYDLNLYAFQNNLNSLRTSLYSGKNKTLSYTIKTNVLRDYARDNYGIRLSRQSSVILNEAIENVKSSIRGSVLLMCKEYGIADTSEYYKNVETEFERLEKEAKAKYGDTDVVSIIQYIQSGMTACFKGICEELDCLATQQQLKRFLEKYSINVKEEVADDYCWDKLFSKYGDGNKEISAEDFNNIFEISCEEPDPQNVYGSYVLASKKTIEFTNDMIPGGYTLKPILVKMNGDPYTNTYSVDVDYTLVKTDYIKKENVAQLTAHSSALKNKSFYEDENKSIFDLNASDEEREYTNYVLPITKKYEEQQINATYFNNEDFKFSWSTSEEYGYDDFWTEANKSGECKGKLDVSGLATTGMMINGYLLSELLEKDESDKMPDAFNNAVRLVKNTNFSLDFTENDYDAEIDDKKGEIQVNNFIIDYKNSDNTFKASNLINEAISNAINNDSGITKRFSKNLWEHIKANYDDASSIYDNISELSNNLDDLNDKINGLLIAACVLSTTCMIYGLVYIISLIIDCIRLNDFDCECVQICIGLFIMSCLISFGLIPSSYWLTNKNSKFNDYLGTIKNKDSSFTTNIKNDWDYFYSNKEGTIVPDRSKFDNLKQDKVKELKVYYSTYKNKETEEDKKTQSQKDYEQLLNYNNSDKQLYDYLNDFRIGWWIFVVASESVLMLFPIAITAYMWYFSVDNHIECVASIISLILSIGAALIISLTTLLK